LNFIGRAKRATAAARERRMPVVDGASRAAHAG
jgi:hypothetical protein